MVNIYSMKCHLYTKHDHLYTYLYRPIRTTLDLYKLVPKHFHIMQVLLIIFIQKYNLGIK